MCEKYIPLKLYQAILMQWYSLDATQPKVEIYAITLMYPSRRIFQCKFKYIFEKNYNMSYVNKL